jgi:hypothetical protein
VDFQKGILMPTTQQQLELTHHAMREVAQLWVDGLITDKEVAHTFGQFYAKLSALDIADKIDPNTGMRYPTPIKFG